MRLIDADALRKVHCEDCNLDVQEICKSDPVCATLMWLDEAPTIEAEPVKHGRWRLVYDDSAGWVDMCTECEQFADSETFYCPNCGARMDEENEA